ncbi:MAG: hypothetical protein WAU52_15205, partial [Burkholderiales bacterium]
MMRTFLRTLGIALGLAVAALPARAAINSVEPIPANSLIAIGQAHSLVLNWQVVSLAVGFPGTLPYTITSTSGQFRVGATVLATVNTVLSANGSMVSGVPSTVSLAESVIVPPSVTVQANRLGAQTISYVRVFTDGATPMQGSELIVVGGSGSALFGITREALSFDDGAAVRVVQKGDRLSAR